MTPPKIYVSNSPITGKLDDIWHDVRFTKDDFVYFSEEAVREAQFIILHQVSKTLSATYGIQINSAHITEDIIRILKGVKNDCH